MVDSRNRQGSAAGSGFGSSLAELASLLLSPDPSAEERAGRQLADMGFNDGRGAWRSLARMATTSEEKSALCALLPQLLIALARAAAPETSLVSLERFVRSVPDRPDLLRHLRSHPRALEILLTLFSGSRFLTEILLRHPDAFASLAKPWDLSVLKTSGQILDSARAASAAFADGAEFDDSLRRFQRLELLRVGACDLLGLFDLDTVTKQLTAVADGLVAACLERAERETGIPAKGFAVVAMGKLGGRELNYSSDIDLLFLARGDAPSYWGLGKRLIESVGRATAEGFLYRVDMRLRPWGEAGPLVSSHEGYLNYLGKHARLWEKQALLKARVIAGEERAGQECLRQAEPLIFQISAEAARGEVREMRQLTEREIRRKGLERSEVKLGEGSIRDVEFVVQYLQLAHGGGRPDIRTGNTREALARLEATGILPPEEIRVLREGYVFLRTIEHHLQVMHYRQTHTLPAESEALGELARRLGFLGEKAGENFRARHGEHATAIRAVYMRHLGGEKMSTPTVLAPTPSAPAANSHAARMDPSYATTFDDDEIRRHAVLAGQLDDAHPVAVDAVPLPDRLWRVTIVGYDFPGELSLICGLLFASGFGILQAEAFTYEPLETSAEPSTLPPRSLPYRAGGSEESWGETRRRRSLQAATGRPDSRRKTADVFVVSPLRDGTDSDVWERLAKDLEGLLVLLKAGRQGEARGEIARRAAATQQAIVGARAPLYPVDIEIDNENSEKYTILRIDAPDTAGFLYEFTNALALNGIYISRMTAGSVGSRVHDTLWVTDTAGQKITDPGRQRELRAATVLIKHFTHLLPHAPNPEAALLHFGEFIGQLLSRPDWPDELATLESPKVLDALAQLLGVSDFLWADFLRMQYANLFPIVRDVDVLTTAKSREALQAELDALLGEKAWEQAGTAAGSGWREALNAFKDRELFRIDMRHILGHTIDIAQFSAELGDLSEVVVAAAHDGCLQELVAQYGRPLLADGSPCQVSVCALGKCGGREMGFASDIELMFIYAGDGATSGERRISTSQFHEKLVQAFVAAIRAKKEGVFEIDLRLRPYGNAGSMAVSLEAFRRYFARTGPAWPYERQSLIRLRPIGGDVDLGRQLVEVRDALVYDGTPPDVTAIRAMRERQVRHLVTPGSFNPKFSPGGLVDVEYLVQGLQILHGHDNPDLRATNTREAMAALERAGVLSPEDYKRLQKAQTFLRWLIEALRVVRGNARDVTIPAFGSDEFSFLGRRLCYSSDLADLKEEMARVSATVREQNARLLG